MSDPEDPSGLKQRLERLERLNERREPDPAPERRRDPRRRVNTRLGVGMALIAVAIATGNYGILIPGVILVVMAAAAYLQAASERTAPPDPTRPHVGMGATVEQDAILEPGATVEMGATVKSGAVVKQGATVEMGATVESGAEVRRGAIVRMGATVHASAVIEEGATIGWGAEVKPGAVVGEGAIIGAGATVNAGATVPARMRLAPGSTWAQSSSPVGAPSQPAPVPADPRAARIDAACDKIAAELQQAPPQIREHLGTSVKPSALRDTCRDLARRERTLRAEASAESFAFLDQEQQTLQEKIDRATDEAVRRSLQSAVAAVADQRRQRERVKVSADRLDAELTRLQYTLEGMAAGLVRLRTTGVDASAAPGTEMLRGVQQLHEEIDAIADALEELSGPAPSMEPIAPIEGDGSGVSATRERTR